MANPEYQYDQSVTVFGGGTGNFTLLRGLVQLNNPEKITAVASSWDSGGSSGELRTIEGILPPGDYMQCILALMEDPEQVQEAILLLKDRSSGHPLVNQLAAIAEKKHHGVEAGIIGISKLFRNRARVLPASTVDLDLYATTARGDIIKWEHEIDHKQHEEGFSLRDRISKINFNVRAIANPHVIGAIKKSDKIIMAQGSPFTSQFPHFLIEGVPQTIKESNARLILVVNLMTGKGEDHHLNPLSEWLKVFQSYLGDKEYIAKNGRSRIDYLLVHRNGAADADILKDYALQGQKPVITDAEECIKLAPQIEIVYSSIAGYDLISHLYRHDPLTLGKALLELA